MMIWISLLCGALFGLGLTISGMVLPEKVLGFLDLLGDWDPSLALVMGGALLVFMPGYFWLVKPRERSLLGAPFHLPTKRQIDKRLITGSALFGIGWGLVGICPGPALTSLVTAQWPVLLFVVAMLVGIKLVCWWEARTRHG
ncbi:MAG: DUF6691 family protein [Aeromonadaceae bacterium]